MQQAAGYQRQQAGGGIGVNIERSGRGPETLWREGVIIADGELLDRRREFERGVEQDKDNRHDDNEQGRVENGLAAGGVSAGTGSVMCPTWRSEGVLATAAGQTPALRRVCPCERRAHLRRPSRQR